jgi:hypothetical protein
MVDGVYTGRKYNHCISKLQFYLQYGVIKHNITIIARIIFIIILTFFKIMFTSSLNIKKIFIKE